MKDVKEPLAKLSNKQAEVGVDPATGHIKSLVFKSNGTDLFKQLKGYIRRYTGGIRVFDELDRKWYGDLDSKFTVSDFKAGKNEISFVKKFAGAPFTLKIILQMRNDSLLWRVEARKNSRSVADRSMRVHFQLPIIAGWNVWGPCKGGQEFVFDGMTGFQFMYTQNTWVSDYDVILPMCSHYHKKLDVGFSLMNPIDGKVPASKLQFCNGERGFNWGGGGGGFEMESRDVPYLELVNYYIGLVGDRTMSTEAVVMFHEGCWRTGVEKVFNRWKEYFVPPNPKMYDCEGVFHCGSMDSDLKECKKGHLRTMEVHEHFEYYAVYYNEKNKWLKNGVKEGLWHIFGGKKGEANNTGKNAWQILEWIDQHTDREILQLLRDKSPHKHGGPEIQKLSNDVSKWTDAQVQSALYWTHDVLRKRLKDAIKLGIEPFWYYNYTDGFRPVAEKRWPDAICRYENGDKCPSGWQMCHNMNADPKYSFGKYLIECTKKIVKEYPGLRGFFKDCFRHYEIDFAHDDGITVVNNKPAYSINFSYDDIDEAVSTILIKNGMCSFANKPQNIRIMRWTDGMMLEGNGDQMEEKYFWSAIAKPIIFLWTTNEASVDENYRRSVYHGCFPRLIKETGWTKSDVTLLDRYMPLFEQFKHRVFCFDPDPIRVPKGSRAKLFTVGKDYVAGIINTSIDEGDSVKYHGVPNVVFRLRRGCDVGKVGVMYPGDKKMKFVKFKFDGTFIFVPMEKYQNCAVVKLFVTKKTGKKIVNKPFPTVIDYCGDPKSAFEDLGSL